MESIGWGKSARDLFKVRESTPFLRTPLLALFVFLLKVTCFNLIARKVQSPNDWTRMMITVVDIYISN
jgi:hypothetical protein